MGEMKPYKTNQNMMINSVIRQVQATMFIIILFASLVNAQVPQDSELFKTLKAKDSLMFDIGFNQCNLAQLEELLPEQFEFYHDKDGITKTRAAFIKTLNKNLCSSGQNPYKRTLEAGSMEVFPLYEHGELYGALMNGKHSFGNTSARFTNLFLLANNEWVPSRMLSYDHKMKEPAVIADVTFIKLSSSEVSRYLGDYEFSPDFVLSIKREGEKIYGDAQGQKAEIKPYGDHQFLDESQTMKLTFISSETGEITGLTMQSANGNMTAKRKK